MNKDKALRMALEALQDPLAPTKRMKAITAIKEALSSPNGEAQPEPWEKFCDSNCVWTDHHPDCKLAQPEKDIPKIGCVNHDCDKCKAQPEQEPVALPCCGYTDASAIKWNPYNQVVQCHNCGQVYTTPPQRKPLTDEQIIAVVPDPGAPMSLGEAFYKFARAIEAAHGIKE